MTHILNRIKKTLGLSFAILCMQAVAQSDTNMVLLYSLNIEGTSLTTDALGNIYVTGGSTLTRYSESGEFQYSYSDVTSGSLTSADASDPLKVLLFSREFGQIRFLDNTLTLKNDVVLLADLGFFNAELACTSYESGFWIYDPVSLQLVRFNHNLQALQFSGNIAQLAGFEVFPCDLDEHDNLVYLCDSVNGILMFDRYGAYLKALPFRGIRSLRVQGETFFMFNGREMIAYHTVTRKENRLSLSSASVAAADISRGRLCLLTPDKLLIYKLK